MGKQVQRGGKEDENKNIYSMLLAICLVTQTKTKINSVNQKSKHITKEQTNYKLYKKGLRQCAKLLDLGEGDYYYC